jgi:hypothetical protein
MDKLKIVLIITAITIGFSVLIRAEKEWDNMTYIKSNINGTEYRVRKLKDCQEAADLLAETHIKMKETCNILEKNNPTDARVLRLKERFPNTSLSESDGYGSQTSFSINKGEKIVLCLRSKDGSNKFVDKNLLLFVALHEMSHIMTISIGHEDEFWNNFKFMLKECQNNGIYKCINFSSDPKSYCGITVTSSPQSCN